MSTWFDDITKKVNEYDTDCKINGPLHVYNRKGKRNPYSFGSAAEFTKNSGFNIKKREKDFKKRSCIVQNGISTEKDKYMRYFIEPRNKKECDVVRGTWDDTSMNRSDRYRRGVCWTDEDNAACGKYIEQDTNLPGVDPAQRKQAVNKSKSTCLTDEKCAWVAMTHKGKDCFSKKALAAAKSPPSTAFAAFAAIAATNAMHPSSTTIPADITTKEADIQNKLKNFYDTPVAPKVSILEGTGNRCAPPAKPTSKTTNDTTSAQASPIIDRDINKVYTIEELKMFPIPLSPIDRQIFVAAFGERHVRKLENSSRYIIRNSIADDNLIWKEIPYYWVNYELKDTNMDDDDHDDDHHAKDAASKLARPIFSSDYLPSIPQSVVNVIMKHIAMHPESTNKGLMAWHSTGSGKTCTAAGVMDAFWDSEKQIVFASSIDAIASNPDYKFHECAARLFPRFQHEPFNGDMGILASKFAERGIIFVSFAKLANRIKKTETFKQVLGITAKQPNPARKKGKKQKQAGGSTTDPFLNRIAAWYGMSDDIPRIKNALREANISGIQDFVDLDHCVLIIDEVHNLFRPLAAQKEKHNFVEQHIVDPLKHPSLKVVILTATPGDNVKDVIKLINIVRDPTKPAITPPNPEDASDVLRFKDSIRGLVSYFEMSNDTTKFPRVRDHGPKMYPMSTTQFARYLEAFKDVKADSKNYEKLASANQLNKFWASARKYSNMLYQLEKGMDLSEFSSKLPALLANFFKYPAEKHYAYSAFYEKRGSSQGILAIAAQLEKEGYEKLTVKEAKSANQRGETLKAKKRYILAIQSEIGEEGTSSAGKNLGEMIKIYNSAANKNGELVHVFLASQGFNEGLDLKAVKHIHIFEPLVTMASDLQTIGRARRYCSHADLELDQWTVDIHRYMTDLPLDFKTSSNEGQAARVQQIKDSINLLKEQVKDAETKEAKQILKETIAAHTKEVKSIEADVKKIAKMADKNVENIDKKIYEEAQRRMRELFVVYHSMKEAAVDCLMLNKFHADPTIKCAF